jgi:uncharacterized paraquat-inducible protein A
MGGSGGAAAAVGILAGIAIGAAIAMAMLRVQCPYCGAVFNRPGGQTAACPNCRTWIQLA